MVSATFSDFRKFANRFYSDIDFGKRTAPQKTFVQHERVPAVSAVYRNDFQVLGQHAVLVVMRFEVLTVGLNDFQYVCHGVVPSLIKILWRGTVAHNPREATFRRPQASVLIHDNSLVLF